MYDHANTALIRLFRHRKAMIDSFRKRQSDALDEPVAPKRHELRLLNHSSTLRLLAVLPILALLQAWFCNHSLLSFDLYVGFYEGEDDVIALKLDEHL